MRQKLRDSRGETLVEVMASIVIATLSIALLLGGIMASARVERGARDLDRDYYQYLSAAEAHDGSGTEGGAAKSGELTIQNTASGLSNKFDILLYGGSGMWAYGLKGAGP